MAIPFTTLKEMTKALERRLKQAYSGLNSYYQLRDWHGRWEYEGHNLAKEQQDVLHRIAKIPAVEGTIAQAMGAQTDGLLPVEAESKVLTYTTYVVETAYQKWMESGTNQPMARPQLPDFLVHVLSPEKGNEQPWHETEKAVAAVHGIFKADQDVDRAFVTDVLKRHWMSTPVKVGTSKP